MSDYICKWIWLAFSWPNQSHAHACTLYIGILGRFFFVISAQKGGGGKGVWGRRGPLDPPLLYLVCGVYHTHAGLVNRNAGCNYTHQINPPAHAPILHSYVRNVMLSMVAILTDGYKVTSHKSVYAVELYGKPIAYQSQLTAQWINLDCLSYCF